MKPPAVILGAGVNGLGIIRSLAMNNVPLYGLYTKKEEVGRYSRYVNSIKMPDLKKEPDKFLEKLLSFGSKLNYRSFLIPERDSYASFVSENRKILEKFFIFNILHKDILDRVLDKKGNMELAIKHNVLSPRTIYLNNESDVDEIVNEFKFPIIIKPLDTFSTRFPGNKKNIVIDNSKLLVSLINDHEYLFGNSIIQELIIGLDGNIVICSVYFSKNSEPLAVYTGRKIRQYKPDYGVTCFGISEYIPEIEQISINFLKKMQYIGLGTLEFVRDKSSGLYYFIEINGRSYYHNSLFTDCGVNLSYIAYCDALGLEIKSNYYKQKENIIWLDFSRDLASFFLKHREHKITISEWLLSIIKARSFAVFNKSDIKPFLFSTLLLIKNLYRKINPVIKECRR